MTKNIPKTGKRPDQDCRERQTLPLRQVPQTKPEAREDSRALVLPGLPQGER